MSANKENLKATEERTKTTMKGNKDDLAERNPLKTLLHTNAEHCVAGPSSGSSRPVNMRYVINRNFAKHHCDVLDRAFIVFNDTPRKPDRNDKDNEKTIENKTSKKYDSAEKEDNKIKKTENEPSYREKDPEHHQWACEKYDSNREMKTEDAIQVDIEEDFVKIEITKTNEDSVRSAPDVPVVIKNTPLDVVVNTPNVVEILSNRKVKTTLKRTARQQMARILPVSAKSYQFTIYSSIDIKVPILSEEKCFDPLNKGYIMDNLNYLLHTEKTAVLGEPIIRSASRSCIINWIININGSSGNPAVVQLASWYFDCFLSSALVTVNGLQMIAAACFWIATKIHARYSIVSVNRLVKYSGYAFTEQELLDAERIILQELKFQAVKVVPHDYVPYFSWCSDDTGSGLVEDAAVFLCQCGVMTHKTLSAEYPSVVAAAAVKNALILLRMEASMHKLTACPIFKAAMEKAVNLDTTCAELRDAVRVVASGGYEYKAPLIKYSAPPHYISYKIVRAIYQDIGHGHNCGHNSLCTYI